ncbi:MAG: tetratricopeptide repeat protein [Flavobacteriales bacterium]
MKHWIIVVVIALAGHGVHAQDPAGTTAESADVLFQQGETAYRNGGYAKAIGYFTQTLALDPDHLNAYLQRGFCHSLQREYDLAVMDLTSVIQRKPDHLWAYTSRGSAYGKLGRNDLAMADFDKVLQLDPHNQEAYNNRGWTKKAQGDADGACKDWNTSKKMGNTEAKIILKNNHCK